MTKVAKLVYISLATRVVVDENATDDEILKVAKPNFIEKIDDELGEHLEEIVDDDECPYEPCVECGECGWQGEKFEVKTNMIPNIHNRQDKTLYEIRVCPECGTPLEKI